MLMQGVWVKRCQAYGDLSLGKMYPMSLAFVERPKPMASSTLEIHYDFGENATRTIVLNIFTPPLIPRVIEVHPLLLSLFDF